MFRCRPETVDFALFRLTHSDLLKKLTNTDALIALKLNYYAVFLMFDNRTIAGEFLLQRAQEKLLIELFSDTLNRRNSVRSSVIATDLNGSQHFPSATLLSSNTNDIRASLTSCHSASTTIRSTHPGCEGAREETISKRRRTCSVNYECR